MEAPAIPFPGSPTLLVSIPSKGAAEAGCTTRPSHPGYCCFPLPLPLLATLSPHSWQCLDPAAQEHTQCPRGWARLQPLEQQQLLHSRRSGTTEEPGWSTHVISQVPLWQASFSELSVFPVERKTTWSASWLHHQPHLLPPQTWLRNLIHSSIIPPAHQRGVDPPSLPCPRNT